MNVPSMLQELNQEIARLTHIRDLLAETAVVSKPGPGRPKGSTNAPFTASTGELTPRRRTLSAEAREKIAAAQRKRWAAGKKASKSAAKPGVVKTIRATPPVGKKAVKGPAPAKKSSPSPARQASRKTAPPKGTIKRPPAKKQPSVKTLSPTPEATETTTSGE